MPKDIRLIAFDLDDTALDQEKVLRPAVAQAICAAAQKGVVILPATGRMLSGIPVEVLDIPGIRYAITSNGAKVYDLIAGEVLYQDCFSVELALEVLEELNEFGGFISIFINGISYTTSKDTSELTGVETPQMLEYLNRSRVYTPDIVSVIESCGEFVEKFTVYYPKRQVWQAANSFFSARGDLSVTSSVETNLELNTKTAKKGAALLRLAAKLGIDKEQVMAVGDSSNDIEMLRVAGHGVAMGNANPQVLQVADEVGPGYEEDGLAVIIQTVMEE